MDLNQFTGNHPPYRPEDVWTENLGPWSILMAVNYRYGKADSAAHPWYDSTCVDGEYYGAIPTAFDNARPQRIVTMGTN